MKLYLLSTGTIAAIRAPVPVYLIRTDDGDMLVDSGCAPGAQGGIVVAPEQHLLPQLAALKVAPEDVRYVICTHLDPDHCGSHRAFTSARFVVQRTHLDLVRDDAPPRIAECRAQWDLPADRYLPVEGDTEFRPGIELIASGGHVPGHQSVLVRLPETGPVLLAGDAIPMEIALNPERRPIFPFDMDAAATRSSTARLTDIARRENALVVCGHDGAQWAGLRTAPDFYR
ncbi:N-acyl homoserine lactonase family protein [Sinosporangium siamense]|uniref:MBL fold metallo-hydrolase n=1 Tax=Sinosporangium siamense TaxID=1367973 RepID=A0A919RN75_9ACTN|nr:N-acyl homoserine lactonase family protein [Sinosporangium siamense]GII95079.1 MBL fold metallo-hydrolase [Sinosporangium siamense]